MLSVGMQIDQAQMNKVKTDFQSFIKQLNESAKVNINTTANGVNNISSNFNSASNSVNSFNGSIGNSVLNMAKLAIGVGSVYQAFNTLKGAVSTVKEMDDAITNISMITNKSISDVTEMSKGWLDLAINMKTTTEAVTETEEKFLRAGKKIDEVNSLTQTSIKLSRVANEDSSATADNLIKLSNAYSLSADQVARYANQVAYLDSSTATTSSAINNAVVYTAQAAMQTGTSLDFLLGMISTVEEKSKQGAEAVGRAFKSIFLNMEKIQSGDDTKALSKLESTLNKQGIALRESETEWRKSEDVIKDLMARWKDFDSVTQSTITQYIAGKNQAEQFNIVMNSSARVLENYNNAMGATTNLNDKYEKHLDSLSGKMNELKSTSDKFWLSLINSSAVKDVIGGLTDILTVSTRVATGLGSMNTAILAITTSLILFKAKAIGELTSDFVAMCAGETLWTATTVGLSLAIDTLTASMLALLTNPVTWLVGAVGLVVAGIVAWENHQQELIETTNKMTQAQKDLNQAIRDGDMVSVKKNSDDLKEKQDAYKDLLAQKKQLEDEIKKQNEEGSKNQESYLTGSSGTLGEGNANYPAMSQGAKEYALQLKNVNDQLKQQADSFDKAGVSINKNTGNIQQLNTAYQLVNVSKLAEDAKTEANNRKQLDQSIIGNISRYDELSNISARTAAQQKEMSNIALDLAYRNKDLKISYDQNGNAIISNNSLLEKQKEALELDIQTTDENTKAKINNAINSMTFEYQNTKYTLSQVESRINAYKAEVDAMSNLAKMRTADQQGDFTYVDTKTQQMLDYYQGIQGQIDKIKNSVGTTKAPDTGSTGGYIPTTTTKTTSQPADQEVSDALIAKDRYANLNELLAQQNTLLDSNKALQDQADSNNDLSSKIDLMKQENKLLSDKQTVQKNITTEQQKERDELVSSLSSQGINFSGSGDTASATNAQDVLNAKIDEVNSHKDEKNKTVYNAEKAQYTDLSKDVTRFFELQDNLIPKSQQAWLGLVSDMSKVGESIGKASIEDVTNSYDKSITGIEDKLKDLELAGKKVASTDFVGQIDNLIQKQGLENDEIAKTSEALEDLNKLQPTTAEGQKNLSDTIEKTTDTLRSQQSALIDTQNEEKSLALSLETTLLENQQKIAEANLEATQTAQKTALANSVYGTSGIDADAVIKAYDDANEAQQTYYQNQIDALNAVNDAQEVAEQRLKNQNDLIEKQTALQTAQNNKTTQTMTQSSDGKWNYSYVADASAVESAQKAVDDQITSNSDYEKQQLIKTQTDELTALKKNLADQKTAKDNAYATQLATLETAQKQETSELTLHYSDMNTLASSSLATLQKTYKDDWSAIIAQLTSDVAKAKELQQELAAAQAGVAGGSGISISSTGTMSSGGKTIVSVFGNGNGTYTNTYSDGTKEVKHYAEGTENAVGGTSLVDEQGVETKVSGGRLTTLNVGDGIITADITKNLNFLGANALNMVSGFQSLVSKFNTVSTPDFSSIQKSNANSGTVNHYSIGNVTLQNVQNPEGLFRGLKNLAYQAASGAMLID